MSMKDEMFEIGPGFEHVVKPLTGGREGTVVSITYGRARILVGRAGDTVNVDDLF